MSNLPPPVTFTLTTADLARYRALLMRRAVVAGNIEAFDKQTALGVPLVIGLIIVVAWGFGVLLLGVGLGVGLLIGFVAQAVLQNLRQARMTRVLERGAILTLVAQTLTMSEEGLHLDGQGRFGSFWGWDTIREVIEDGPILVLLVSEGQGVLVPASTFAGEGAREAFVAQVRARMTGVSAPRP